MRSCWNLGLTLAVGALTAAAPAHAQQSGEAELDALVDASRSPDAALALARRQAADGDLTGAAATLERALLTRPQAGAVRAYYAALLCRLDDHQRARIELAHVGSADTSEAQAACGDLGIVRKDGAAWQGQVALGLAYDQDAGGALTIRLDVPGVVYPKQDGLAFIGSAGVNGRIPLDDEAFVYGGVDISTRNSLSGPAYDYQVAGANLGTGIRTGPVELSAGGAVLYVRALGGSFLTEYAGQARAMLALGPDARLTVRGEVAGQDYVSAPGLSRDGTRYDLSADLSGGVQDRTSYVVGAGWERKTADTNYLAYHGYRLYGALRIPFGSGVYGSLGGTFRHIDYYNDPTTRDYVEDRYFGRIAVGVSIVRHLVLEAAGTATRRDYNAASGLRDYQSVGGELRLIFTFGNQGSGK